MSNLQAQLEQARAANDTAAARLVTVREELGALERDHAEARAAEIAAANADDEVALKTASKTLAKAAEAVRIKRLQVDGAGQRAANARAAVHDVEAAVQAAGVEALYQHGRELVATLNGKLIETNNATGDLLALMRKLRSDYRAVPGAVDRAGFAQRFELGLKNNLLQGLSALSLGESRGYSDIEKTLGEWCSALAAAIQTTPPPPAARERPSDDFVFGALEAIREQGTA